MSRRALATAAAAAVAMDLFSLAFAVGMTDVGGMAAAACRALAIGARARRAAVAALGQLEAQRAGNGIGLGEAQSQPLADLVGFAGLLADQLLGALVVAEIFRTEVAHEDEPVAAEVLDRGEKAERLDAGDPAFDQLALPVGEIGRDIA